jgi:hypothetical protein
MVADDESLGVSLRLAGMGDAESGILMLVLRISSRIPA